MNLILQLADAIPPDEAAQRWKTILVIGLTILGCGVMTIIAGLEGHKGKYRIDVNAPPPDTLPTVRNPCTCGTCACCDPLALAIPGKEIDPLAASVPGFQLPQWAIDGVCAHCGVRNSAACFLSPGCQLVAGRSRVHHVYRLLDDGEDVQAWRLAESICRDLKHFGERAACN